MKKVPSYNESLVLSFYLRCQSIPYICSKVWVLTCISRSPFQFYLWRGMVIFIPHRKRKGWIWFKRGSTIFLLVCIGLRWCEAIVLEGLELLNALSPGAISLLSFISGSFTLYGMFSYSVCAIIACSVLNFRRNGVVLIRQDKSEFQNNGR